MRARCYRLVYVVEVVIESPQKYQCEDWDEVWNQLEIAANSPCYPEKLLGSLPRRCELLNMELKSEFEIVNPDAEEIET